MPHAILDMLRGRVADVQASLLLAPCRYPLSTRLGDVTGVLAVEVADAGDTVAGVTLWVDPQDLRVDCPGRVGSTESLRAAVAAKLAQLLGGPFDGPGLRIVPAYTTLSLTPRELLKIRMEGRRDLVAALLQVSAHQQMRLCRDPGVVLLHTPEAHIDGGFDPDDGECQAA